MEIYRSLWQIATRLKPDVWIESGYATPPLARSYAHSWRLADDYPAFSNPFPFAGLVEQLTYAILERQMLGRRPHLGFIYGSSETLPIQRQWLGAAVALQAQTVLSTDLASLPVGTTRIYREYLAALRPFSTDSVFGPGTPPEAFSSTVGGTTYLGLLNQHNMERLIEVDLAHHGIAAQHLIAFDPATGEAFTSGVRLVVSLPAQTFRLLVLRSAPGVLWSDRNWTIEDARDGLRVRVDAGGVDAGLLRLHAPDAREVFLDGVLTTRWILDSQSGLMTIAVPDAEVHEVRVAFSPARPVPPAVR